MAAIGIAEGELGSDPGKSGDKPVSKVKAADQLASHPSSAASATEVHPGQHDADRRDGAPASRSAKLSLQSPTREASSRLLCWTAIGPRPRGFRERLAAGPARFELGAGSTLAGGDRPETRHLTEPIERLLALLCGLVSRLQPTGSFQRRRGSVHV